MALSRIDFAKPVTCNKYNWSSKSTITSCATELHHTPAVQDEGCRVVSPSLSRGLQDEIAFHACIVTNVYINHLSVSGRVNVNMYSYLKIRPQSDSNLKK